MKLELKHFQEIAAADILTKLDKARRSVGDGDLEAIVLSAPTGSGKTITVAAVIDQTFGGGEGVKARPETIFLWLSDSPELNEQSKGKLLAACDHVPFNRMVTIGSETFDAPRLKPGHVYFINTQLLGKDKRLTQGGDKRQYTFWQTVANTVSESPESLVLVIDEAHRGASANDRTRKPIMQKFITGSDADGLPAIPIVLGMSATPQRFTDLLGSTARTQRPVNITPEDVRSSGLLKDVIIVHNPKTDRVGDLTLLEQAATRWKHFTSLWDAYCTKEREKTSVRPILVVQVEDGVDGKVLTRTNLADVVRVIERQTGTLALNEIVHCFQEQGDIEAGGRTIRKIDASRIQENNDVKVVLFKTALTTGWDCPRAETMMSFRRAQDPTSIAQLVGRMIRTPLARRIERDEVLNTVDLFLPHYDAGALEGVLNKLRNPDAGDAPPTRVETGVLEYSRNPKLAEVFKKLEKLPTYSIERAPRLSEVKRALRLAGMLVHEGIDSTADEKLRELLTKKLSELRDIYAVKDKKWDEEVKEGGEIEVDITMVAVGQMNVTERKTVRMALSQENIDQLFDTAGQMIAASEGLHRTYWKRYHDKDNPNKAKLELFAVVRRPETIPALEKLAGEQFNALWKKNKEDVQALQAADKSRFHALLQSSGKPVELEWELPEQIIEKKEGIAWAKHLYTDKDGKFYADLNKWERELLEKELAKKEVVGWLRNLDRREWAICIPYELGTVRPFYPDFVIVRKGKKGFIIDIIEPHDSSRDDTWAKAKGLAAFAEKHGMDFGRLVIARKQGNKLQSADVNDPAKRAIGRTLRSQNDIESLFAD